MKDFQKDSIFNSQISSNTNVYAQIEKNNLKQFSFSLMFMIFHELSPLTLRLFAI